MPPPAAALIAASNLFPALKDKLSVTGDVLMFPDTEPLEAIDAILRERPPLVVLERFFAATPRGVALIRRLQSDASLAETEIRVLAHDSDYARVIVRREAPKQAVPLDDPTGTRRARRFAVPEGTEAQVDGKAVTLVDLSTGGAQVLSAGVLRPSQRVRLALWIEHEAVRVAATVEWSAFEMDRATGETRYRAGLQFIDADTATLERFCERL